MNRNELITTVADNTGFTKTDTGKVLDGILEAITGAMSSGDEVRLVGFGTFSVSERAASKGRNPRTGEPIDIAARKLPRFKAGTGLKEAVNG
ncbi:MAG: HU family DNA-binding protein [Alphaproteobacteria bacterium]